MILQTSIIDLQYLVKIIKNNNDQHFYLMIGLGEPSII